jgi:hypothetical protein
LALKKMTVKSTLIFYGKAQTVSMPCRKCGKVMFRIGA